jgi:thioredoxin 1
MRLFKMFLAAAVVFAGVGARAQILLPPAHIYPDVSAAPAQIKAALAGAHREHKRVLLDFGGDWCEDCQVLNYYMHQPPNAALLQKYYVLVDINIGHIDQNLDLGAKYGDVLHKGVPALSVVRWDGTVVYGQQTGQFDNMRALKSSDLTAFLEKWRAH